MLTALAGPLPKKCGPDRKIYQQAESRAYTRLHRQTHTNTWIKKCHFQGQVIIDSPQRGSLTQVHGTVSEPPVISWELNPSKA